MQDLVNKPIGVRKITAAHAVIGFVRFLSQYYIYLVTKQKHIGNIGPHKVYSIVDTMHIPVTHPLFQEAAPSDEDRYRTLFFRFDLTQDFYYSPTYPLTYTLQRNMIQPLLPEPPPRYPSYNDLFAWNHYLLEPLIQSGVSEHWMVPIIHGSFVQHNLDVIGRTLQLTVIARRSRLFAGARFQKRGIDEQGHVANDVEMEQILTDPNMGLFSHSSMSSYVQHRGSIPLYWAQISAGGVIPKPPISIQRVDPYYNSSILHFMDLMKRYGSPLIVLNLIKSRETVPREMILRDAYSKCLEFINSSIADESKRIIYIAWDFKKAAKNNKSKLQRDMYAIAQMSILRTGFFHADKKLYSNELRHPDSDYMPEMDEISYGDPLLRTGDENTDYIGRLQHGAVRTNCIDSIDRTNAAQYLLGLCALSHQLYAMGLIQSPNDLSFDSAISLVLMEMYEIAGHQLALQYGGSGLAHTMNTFVTKSIVDHSKDFLTVVQRYYRNTFTDQEKQNTINLFLGVFRPWEHRNSPDLWTLETDYHLHNYEPERELLFAKPWWVEPLQQHQGIYRPRNPPKLISFDEELDEEEKKRSGRTLDLSFNDYYQTHKLTSFDKFLGKEFLKQRKVTIALPQQVTSAKGDAAGLGIMRWLWTSKSPSPSPAMSRSSSLGQMGTGAPTLDPLDWCGMTLIANQSSISRYTAYCDAYRDWKRWMKKRKRYAYYRRQQLLTHHRRPKLGTDEYRAPSTPLYEGLVNRWERNLTVTMPRDLELYERYLNLSTLGVPG